MTDRFPFDPFAELNSYREAFRQMVESGWPLPRDFAPAGVAQVVIPVDVLDNGTDIVVLANLPGVHSEDVNLTILDQNLTIRAALPTDDAYPGATYVRHERRVTAFMRTVALPAPVDSERAEAKCQNGVLTLTLPKVESVRPKVIRVNAE